MKTEIKSIKIEKECEISGFIETTREQKTMLFIILRDRSGKIQITIEKTKMPELSTKLATLLKDSVLRVKGKAVSAPTVSLGGLEFIPSSIEIESEKYKNPRNLCSGSVRQLNNRITKDRHVRFVAFALISNVEAYETRQKEMAFLSGLGF